jgi:hypothetical protein
LALTATAALIALGAGPATAQMSSPADAPETPAQTFIDPRELTALGQRVLFNAFHPWSDRRCGPPIQRAAASSC